MKKSLLSFLMLSFIFGVSNVMSQETFTLIKDIAELNNLKNDEKVIIVASGSNVAMSSNQKSNNRDLVEIVKTAETIVITDEDIEKFTVIKDQGNYTFYANISAVKGYIYAASSSANHLKTKAQLDDNGIWSVIISEKGIATIKATGKNTRNILRYNSDNTLFSCYASGQDDISLYKGKSSGEVEEVYNEVADINSFITEGSKVENKDEIFKITGETTVLYHNDKNLYVQDEKSPILIYGTHSATYTNGQKLAGIIGTYNLYNGMHQMSPVIMPEAVEGQSVEPNIITETPALDDVHKFVKLTNVKFLKDPGYSTSNTVNGVVTFDGKDFTIRDSFKLGAPIDPSKTYNVTGFVSRYNDGTQEIGRAHV